MHLAQVNGPGMEIEWLGKYYLPACLPTHPPTLPWGRYYRALKSVGELFPGPSKTTRAYLHEETVRVDNPRIQY